ncbi:YozE family protein [Lactobacillus sp. Sy-1]|uniref:YozE family protein n=1 Tax=Lactobacillus sp. Sy-1 TaxID=2109645 RepID=UPI001C5BA944|nr:YozE family protein [Lactobacillus sp. Sy-1]
MTIAQSFYQYLMTERNPKSYEPLAEFANNAFYDHSFPKNTADFDEISQYLEENGSYLPSMTIFDDAWSHFLDYKD